MTSRGRHRQEGRFLDDFELASLDYDSSRADDLDSSSRVLGSVSGETVEDLEESRVLEDVFFIR